MRTPCAEPLAGFNTLALPATAAALALADSPEQLARALDTAERNELPVVVLGEGSNVVFVGDIRALVLRIGLRGIEVMEQSGDQVLLRVAGGENWHALVQWCLEHGYYGLENLALIPGTAGAAPVQNIGAYGVELSSFLQAVHAVEIEQGRAVTLSVEECRLGYRDSVFKHALRDRLVITAIDIQLSRRPAVNLQYPALAQYFEQSDKSCQCPQDVFDAVVDIRRSRLPDPALQPNAGSFFKNPVVDGDRAAELADRYPTLPQYPRGDEIKLPAAWLIDHCGWRGYSEGGVGVHPEHALVLVHYGGADGRALMALAAKIRESVEQRFAIRLEIEPRVYGA